MNKSWVVSVILAALLIFYAGFKTAQNQMVVPVAVNEELTLAPSDNLNFKLFSLSEKEFNAYQNLKDQKSKYDKANEILGKMVLLFIADMGLHLGNGESGQQDYFKPNDSLPSSRTDIKIGSTSTTSNPTGPAVTPSVTSTPDNNVVAESTPIDAPIVTPKKTKLPSMVNAAQAKGAVFALYQAFLWRAPGKEGGAAATSNFTSNGWTAYLKNAREMVGSDEFRNRILPAYTSEQLITHAFSVYFGRCPTDSEYRNHLRYVDSGNFQRAAASIINKARDAGTVELFTGGFNSSTCALRSNK